MTPSHWIWFWFIVLSQVIVYVEGSIFQERLVFGSAQKQQDASCCWLLSDGAFQIESKPGKTASNAELRLYGRLSRTGRVSQREQRTGQVEFIFYPSTRRQHIGYRSPQRGAHVQYCCPLDVSEHSADFLPPGCTAENSGQVIVTTAVATPPAAQGRISFGWESDPVQLALAAEGSTVPNLSIPISRGSSSHRVFGSRKSHSQDRPRWTEKRRYGSFGRYKAIERQWTLDTASNDPDREMALDKSEPLHLQGSSSRNGDRPGAPRCLTTQPPCESLTRGTRSRQDRQAAPEPKLDDHLQVASLEQRLSMKRTAWWRPRSVEGLTMRRTMNTAYAASKQVRGDMGPSRVGMRYLPQHQALRHSIMEKASLEETNASQKVEADAAITDVYRYRLLLPSSTRRIDFGVVTFPVHQSGIYELLVASCMDANLTMNLVLEWQNPHGYLAAQLYPLLPFYGWVTLLYLAAAALWVFLCYVRMSTLHIAHHAMTFLLTLGLLESFIHYQAYHWANRSGARICCPPSGLAMVGDLFATCRHTLTKVMLLAAAMGLQLLSPKLPLQKQAQLKWFGFLYTLSAGSLEILETAAHNQRARLLLLLPVAAVVASLETLFYFWTVTELRQTWLVLKHRNQTEKCRNFRLFIMMLAIYAGLGVIYTVFVVIFNWRTSESLIGLTDENWQLFWLVGPYPGLGTGALGDAASFLILASIAWIWFPTQTRVPYLPMVYPTYAEHGDQAISSYKSATQEAKRTEGIESRFELDDEANAHIESQPGSR